MNIYVRYFDHEDVFTSGQDVVNFLTSINDFTMTPQIQDEVLNYSHSTMPFPKRVKVRNNVYFILIKTTASNLPDFKAHKKDTSDSNNDGTNGMRKDPRIEELREEHIGWYRCEIKFKRVVLIPGTQKCSYRDTVFSAYVYANSGTDCYAQIIDHLRNRQEIDPRSQFPSEKKSNFSFSYIGQDGPIV